MSVLLYIGVGGGDLTNLPLLPLMSGPVVPFVNSSQPKYFISTNEVPASCLPNKGSIVSVEGMSQHTIKLIKQLAMEGI